MGKLIGDLATVATYWMDTTVFKKPRQINGHDDWGDQATVMVKLRRGNRVVGSDFGIWLGQHGNKYVVAICGQDARPVGCEIYDSIDEAKREWEAD